MITKLNFDFKLKFILLFLQIFGVNLIVEQPRDNNRNPKINRYLLAWNTILIIFTITLIVVVYIERANIFYVFHAVGQFTDMIQFLGPAASMLVLLVELYYKRDGHLMIRNNLNKIFEMIPIRLDLFDGIIKRLLIKWLFLFVLTLAVEIFIMVDVKMETVWSLHWYTTIVPLVMIRLGLLYYVIYVDFITGALQTINGILLAVQRQSLATGISQELKNVRETANILWNTVRLVNSIYGWFQLIYNLQLLFMLTCDLYWVVGSFVVSHHLYFLSSVLCNVTPITSMIILFNSTENLKKQGNQVIPNLMKLHKSKFNEKLQIFILRFTYQMTINAYYCDVYGFFTLDYICLRNMIAAICTYISIFRSLSPA